MHKCRRACTPLESYRSLGFANYHLNVFAFSRRLQARRASGFRTSENGTETEVARGGVPLLGLIGEKISPLALPSPASFSFGRHRYADLWRPWNTILMRPLLPLISSLCLAGDFRWASFVRRARLFGETAYDVATSRICQARNMYAYVPRICRTLNSESQNINACPRSHPLSSTIYRERLGGYVKW